MINRRSFFKAIAGLPMAVAGVAAVEALPKTACDPERVGWSQMKDKLAIPLYDYAAGKWVAGKWFKAC